MPGMSSPPNSGQSGNATHGLDAEGERHWVVVLQNATEKLAVSRRQQHIVRELGRIL